MIVILPFCYLDPLRERELGGDYGRGTHAGSDDQGGGGGQLVEVLRQPRPREFFCTSD